MPQYRTPRPAPRGPEFADAADQADAPEVAPEAAASEPLPVTPARPVPRAPKIIAGAVTLIAIAAILLGVFLPREKPTAQQAQGPNTSTPATTQNPAPAGDAQQSFPAQPQPQPGPGVAQSPQATSPQGDAAQPSTGLTAPQQSSPGTATTGKQGNQYVSCPDCGGTGEVACPMKHLPNGHMLNPLFWNEPGYYSGKDPLLPDDADMGECPVCHGTLKTTCRHCNGKGQIIEGTPEPADPYPELKGVTGLPPGITGDITGGAGGG